MTNEELEILKYPIGKFLKPDHLSVSLLSSYILDIENFPSKLALETERLKDEQLDTPYRPGGWSIRQVVHHCADSHMNSIIRFKLALTEEKPIVKPYFEDLWAELPDSKSLSIQPSIQILYGIHLRWTVLLRSLNNLDLQRKFIHPEHGKEFTLEENIGVYAWHCNHHLAHITTLKRQRGWK